MPTRTVRAAAAAPRMLVGRIAVLVDELAAANACTDTFVSSWAAVTWSKDSPSSSAAIWRIAVGEPCPISVQPWKSVTVLSGLTCSHESICAGSGGPGTVPRWRGEAAVGLLEAWAVPAADSPRTRLPAPRRNVFREKSCAFGGLVTSILLCS
jgi:hypothetical protein